MNRLVILSSQHLYSGHWDNGYMKLGQTRHIRRYTSDYLYPNLDNNTANIVAFNTKVYIISSIQITAYFQP